MQRFVIAFVAAAFGLAIFSAPGWTQTQKGLADAVETSQVEQVRAKKQKAKRQAVRRPGGGQIACTPAGCHRIPPGCHPTQGYLWNGMPSGYDVVVCP